ncbi:lipoarabinomannan carrier protein LprG [Mycobacterium novum]|uniref:Lipoarabinomannan carrier protein LprG n=3 Tax=Mycobacteriaceae TaxID=1762 RepID=A0A7I9Y9D5_MYCAL|nr:lipoarabinomannan carrier protein LprG [Mycobacterium novum]GFG85301.1 lipoarabinomannan carrier protein LprG [Mycolicibacter algericus]
MRRLVIALATATTAAALFAGCSSKDAGGPLPDATTLVKESATTTADLKSAHLALSVTGQIKNLPVKTLEGDLTNEPTTAAKGNATITMLGSDVDAKFVVIDGDLYAAITGDDYDNYGAADKIYDVAAILSPDKGLANMLAKLKDPKAQARDTINGQKAVRVTGDAPADAVNALAPQLKATASTPATVWIQEDGDHQLVQAQLDPSAGNSIQMTLSNWNDPVTVEKPAGA